MPLALCPQVMPQAPQHFRSSQKQLATCVGCFACQSICSVISLHSGTNKQTATAKGRKCERRRRAGCTLALRHSLWVNRHNGGAKDEDEILWPTCLPLSVRREVFFRRPGVRYTVQTPFQRPPWPAYFFSDSTYLREIAPEGPQ